LVTRLKRAAVILESFIDDCRKTGLNPYELQRLRGEFEFVKNSIAGLESSQGMFSREVFRGLLDGLTEAARSRVAIIELLHTRPEHLLASLEMTRAYINMCVDELVS